MTLNQFRSICYFVARTLGDINAVLRGRIVRRIGYRLAGKVTGRLLGRLFR